VWQELDDRIDICRVTKGGHIEQLQCRTETWSVSPSVDMLPFAVTIPATVPQRSEIPEGLMNYPVGALKLILLQTYKTSDTPNNMFVIEPNCGVNINTVFWYWLYRCLKMKVLRFIIRGICCYCL
jgi:hypothetical protein